MDKDKYRYQKNKKYLTPTQRKKMRKKARRRKNRLDNATKSIEFGKITDIENLDLVLRYLERSQIKISVYKERYLKRRLNSRISRLNMSSYLEYYRELKRNPYELKTLEKSLSINITRFFRDRDTFEYLQSNIIPQMVENQGKSYIKIWSAGCAVGAEPYTMAMICRKTRFSRTHFKILASDLNKSLIRQAQIGKYSQTYLSELKDSEKRKFFTKISDDEYRLSSSIRSMVYFDTIDLTTDRFPKHLDMVLCRNVLIYIDPDGQNAMIKKFHSSLKTGGYLVLGRTEILRGNLRNLFEKVSSKHRVYRKISKD